MEFLTFMAVFIVIAIVVGLLKLFFVDYPVIGIVLVLIAVVVIICYIRSGISFKKAEEARKKAEILNKQKEKDAFKAKLRTSAVYRDILSQVRAFFYSEADELAKPSGTDHKSQTVTATYKVIVCSDIIWLRWDADQYTVFAKVISTSNGSRIDLKPLEIEAFAEQLSEDTVGSEVTHGDALYLEGKSYTSHSKFQFTKTIRNPNYIKPVVW